MKEKYLPIGTIVLIKGSEKKIMVSGFLRMQASNKDTIFDYCGIPYPEGYKGSLETILFNHNQILEVCHIGFITEDYNIYNSKLKAFIN